MCWDNQTTIGPTIHDISLFLLLEQEGCKDTSLLGPHVPPGCANLGGIDFGRKSERAQGLVGCINCGGDIDKHEGLGISSQAWLKQVGQLRVSVRDVGLLSS